MMPSGRRRFGRYDWDAIAGIVAAGAALVLHFLHIVEVEVLLAIALVLLALLLLRDLRRESGDEAAEERLARTEAAVAALAASLRRPDVVLIGPRDLRRASAEFARRARGEVTWFNVCLLMFRPQELFDVLLRPALENPAVTPVRFILDPSQGDLWETELLPKVHAIGAGSRLAPPVWVPLREEAVSFILTDTDAGTTEAHLSFWGEPFMSRAAGLDIPRFVLHVQPGSELLVQLSEMERRYRTARAPAT